MLTQFSAVGRGCQCLKGRAWTLQDSAGPLAGNGNPQPHPRNPGIQHARNTAAYIIPVDTQTIGAAPKGEMIAWMHPVEMVHQCLYVLGNMQWLGYRETRQKVGEQGQD